MSLCFRYTVSVPGQYPPWANDLNGTFARAQLGLEQIACLIQIRLLVNRRKRFRLLRSWERLL
jgi:hypothetical protein